MRDTDRISRKQNEMDGQRIAHLFREGQGMMTDALIQGLPKIPVHLRQFTIKPHINEIGKLLWQECCFFAHLQDSRLSDKERQVLAAIGKKLNGARCVL